MNTKLLGKTLVASVLVLTTLGTGFHSSYLGLDTNKVVKTAKADSLTDGQLWLGVKKSLIDAQIISGNKDEEVKVSYVRNDGQSSSVTAHGDTNNDFFNKPSDFSKLSKIDITRVNIGGNDFNTTLSGKEAWEKLTKNLLENGLVKNGESVTIFNTDTSKSTVTSVTGKVGEGVTSGGENTLTKRFIDKITIE